jgi:alanine dehydrogenase
MVTVLTDTDVRSLIQLPDIADVVEEAQIKHDAGAVERPDRSHYPIGGGLQGDDPFGTGLVMPAYIHGKDHFATKMASVYETNSEKGLPTVHSNLVLADAHTGKPVAFMNANSITNARTGCIGGVAVRELANKPVELAVIGAGVQARWQIRAVDALCELERVAVYSPSDSKYELADELSSSGIATHAAESPDSAVRNANTVITATTSPTPVFSAEAIQNGTLIVGIGAFRADMQELEPAVFDKADRVFADVPEEVAEIGDITGSSLSEDQLIPLGEIFKDNGDRTSTNEIIVVESVGSAVFDVATAAHIYSSARESSLGNDVNL